MNGLMDVWLDRWMAMAGWMASCKTRLMYDQTQARLDSRTTTHTHDQKHMTRLTHDQTHAQPDSRKIRLTQDMYAIIIPTNSIYPRALP